MPYTALFGNFRLFDKKHLTRYVEHGIMLPMSATKLSENKLTVYVPHEVVQKAKRYALDHETSLSALIRDFLASLNEKKI